MQALLSVCYPQAKRDMATQWCSIIVMHSSGDRQKQARWLQSLKISRWFVSACSRKNTHGFAECTRLCQGKSAPPVPYNNSPLSASANPLSTFRKQKELQKRCTQQHFRPVLNYKFFPLQTPQKTGLSCSFAVRTQCIFICSRHTPT